MEIIDNPSRVKIAPRDARQFVGTFGTPLMPTHQIRHVHKVSDWHALPRLLSSTVYRSVFIFARAVAREGIKLLHAMTIMQNLSTLECPAPPTLLAPARSFSTIGKSVLCCVVCACVYDAPHQVPTTVCTNHIVRSTAFNLRLRNWRNNLSRYPVHCRTPPTYPCLLCGLFGCLSHFVICAATLLLLLHVVDVQGVKIH